MSDNVESMMYVGETPWHGIGTYVGDNPITSKEAIMAAGLNWKVDLQPVLTEAKEGYVEIPDKFATVRMDNRTPLGVVGGRYTVLQNMEAFEFLDSIAGKGQKAMYHTAGSLGVGEKIWIMVKFPKSLQIIKDDVVDKFFVITNSHNGSSPIQVLYTPIRVVCQNTLHQALSGASVGVEKVSIKHTSSIGVNLEEAKKLLVKAEAFWDEFEETSAAFVKKKTTEKSRILYFKNALAVGGKKDEDISTKKKNEVQTLLELVETGKGSEIKGVKGTLWGDYNAVVEYIDHVKKVKKEGEDKSRRLRSVWLGSGRNRKEVAYNEALKLIA